LPTKYLIGATATRNFDDVLTLLHDELVMEPTDEERRRVVQRGLDKRAPFHRSRNSVADALLIEMYASTIDKAQLETDPHGFVTSNSEDFSLVAGDQRQPHGDLAKYFTGEGSAYWLGVDGLDSALRAEFGDEYDEVLEESDFREGPRRLYEILEAESEMFDRIWYNRSINYDFQLRKADDDAGLLEHQKVAEAARRGSKSASVGSRTWAPTKTSSGVRHNSRHPVPCRLPPLGLANTGSLIYGKYSELYSRSN
jgi:hypothetical protein